ncbi:MAG: RecX family transcriptional regulator [Bacteroidota bacterium]
MKRYDDNRGRPKPVYTQQQAKVKVSRYCAYQERSHHEVRQKLAELGMYGDDAEAVIADLISENFINEERFARAYAGGKFRTKQWGRLKIQQGLKQHRISAYCMKAAMKEIDPEAYWLTLQTLAKKRWEHEKKETKDWIRKQKVARYLVGRGFEQDLIWEAIDELIGQ